MKFKVPSLILVIFASIGFFICVRSGFESYNQTIIAALLYVVIPLYGAYGLWRRKQLAIVVLIIFFAYQCIRSVEPGSAMSFTVPISISLPIGDFAKGEGYLIDLFAILMMVGLAWLFNINRKSES
jgi:presenilin-like A22 family membrane protease